MILPLHSCNICTQLPKNACTSEEETTFILEEEKWRQTGGGIRPDLAPGSQWMNRQMRSEPKCVKPDQLISAVGFFLAGNP